GAGKGMADALAGLVDIGMVSREIYPEEIGNGAFYVSVCKDAVVATMNADNPAADTIEAQGLSRDDLIKIFITREYTTWGDVIGDPSVTARISVYTRADACGAAATWASYLGNYSQYDLTNSADTAIMHDPDIAKAVMNDVNAIGYNNVNFAYDFTSGDPLNGLMIIPLDLDDDSSISSGEDFYGSRDDLVEAIANGIYPSPPARLLYLVTKDSFKGPVRDFVEWTLNEGQELIPDNGYIRLETSLLQDQKNILETGERGE
ncbi:MAG: substrate-binding domain-containing protein, partial [Methanosarcinaceae archaeon]